MKRKLAAGLLITALMLTMLAGCGSTAASSARASAAPAESAASAQTAADTTEAAPAEEAAPAGASAEEASAAEETETTTGVPHNINFPGSDTARLDYTNVYELPITEDGMTVSWMRNSLNLIGPLGELGLSTLQDLPAIQELQERTGVTIEYTELDFWTSQEKMNVAIASGDYADIISDLSYTGGATGALNDEYGVDVPNMMRIRAPYTLCSSMMILYRTAEYNTDLKNEAWDVWTSNIDGTYNIPSSVSMNAEETETSSYYVADIVTYASEMIPQFISGDVDIDAEWDTFVEKLHDMSIDECIEAEQSAYDRYLAS